MIRPTQGRTRELTRHFLLHMLDNEWSAGTGQWQAAATGLIALVLPVTLLLGREANPDPSFKMRHLRAAPDPEPFRSAIIADEIALLVLLSVITGSVALFIWQSLFPSSRDTLALAGLPVRPREIFVARFAAVALFAAVLIGGMNILPSLAAPAEFGGRWAANQSVLPNIAAQAAAGIGACAFVFFGLVAIQGLLINVAPARVSFWFQAAFAGGLLLAGLRLWSIREWPMATVLRLPEFGAWWPPVWFAGVREAILGNRDPFWSAMATRGLAATATSIAAALGLYLLTYGRYRRLLLEGASRVQGAPARRRVLLDLLASDPKERGILHFISVTMARSRANRVIWLAYIGGAIALMVNSSIVDGAILSRRGRAPALQFMVLFWPLACTGVLLPGLRHAIAVPSELGANWIFRLHEACGRKQWMRAVERFVIAYAIVPIYLLLAPVSFYQHGISGGARITLLQVMVSLTMFDALFQHWQQLPFACAYRPGKRPLVAIVAGYVAMLGAIVPTVSILIAAAGRSWPVFGVLAPMIFGLWLKVHWGRCEGWGETPLLYDDTGNDILTLSIGGRGPRIAGGHADQARVVCQTERRVDAWICSDGAGHRCRPEIPD